MNKNVCVIGAGYWGKNHINTLHRLGALGGVVDSCNKILDSINDEFPHINIYSDLNDAINDGYDGFTIATPSETHFEVAKKIILSKRHV